MAVEYDQMGNVISGAVDSTPAVVVTKTPVKVAAAATAPKGVTKVSRTNKKNVLNSYRSYNYVFTLASLSKRALTDPLSYRENNDYFVIAKSGGKGTAGIALTNSFNAGSITPNAGAGRSTPGYVDPRRLDLTSADKAVPLSDYGKTFLDRFNTSSPGRFDFFIDNVNIDTIMNGGESNGLSTATKIEFEITEPYSMTGFIEALQASALAAGYDQYINTPYLLKMEFIGYPDELDLPETAQVVPRATRYFVFSFTGMEISVTEAGARYQCKGVPHNERGFGEPSKLKTNIKIAGNNVGQILTNFAAEINEAKSKEAVSEKDPTKKNNYDRYEIIYPNVDNTGIVLNSTNTNLTSATLGNLLKSSANYAFSDPGEKTNTSTTTVLYKNNPTSPVASFAEGSSIQECITSIIRDSSYTQAILKDFPKNVDKATGTVPYFIVNIETEDTNIMNETTHKPYCIYRYVILPYKLNYKRIPLAPTVDTLDTMLIASRQYDYLYTGSNVDIKSFKLNFNTLFFQAIPKAMGNAPGLASQSKSTGPSGASTVSAPTTPASDIQQSAFGVARVMADSSRGEIQTGNTPNSGLRQLDDPYDALSRNLHQAILDNVDQCTAEVDIIGDPFYLVTSGMGNYRPKLTPGNIGETLDGEASYNLGDVMILLTFRNPVDISEVTGEAIFNDNVVSYSGLFRVTTVATKFNDGVFTQRLNLLRIPAQYIDTRIPIAPSASILNVTQNAEQAATTPPPTPVSTVRSSSDSLAASIAAGLPVTGLPGTLSSLANSIGGSLAGFTAGATAVGSLLSQVSGGAGASALAGLSNISSTIRLASSGLSAASSSIQSAGASIGQLTATAQSAGISGAANLAKTTLASGLSSVSQIGTTALSAANSLGAGAASLVSGIGAKIDSLKGSQAALASQLGGDTSKLSGLSPALQSKLTKEITDAVNTIPPGVDVASAVKSGLLLNNIPKSALTNIPSTQPMAVAPSAMPNLADIKAILSQGGSIANIPGASSIPGVAALLSASSRITLPTGLGLDSASIAGKLSTIQSGLGAITGQVPSIEGALNSISAAVPTGLPTMSGVASSVVSKFGSISAAVSSPLDIIMKSKS